MAPEHLGAQRGPRRAPTPSERAAAAGIDLVVAAVIGPGSTVVRAPVREPVAGRARRDEGGDCAARVGHAAGRPSTSVGGVLDVDTPHGPARAHLDAGDEPRRRARARPRRRGRRRRRATSSRRRRPPLARGSASRSSSSPIAWRGGARPRRRPSSTRPGSRSSSTCAAGRSRGLPLVAGGRSSGARVACRTAAQTGAVGVLCLAFPVHPPRPPGEDAPARARRRRRPDARGPGRRATRSGCRRAGREREVVTVPRQPQPAPATSRRCARRSGASWARSSACAH